MLCSTIYAVRWSAELCVNFCCTPDELIWAYTWTRSFDLPKKHPMKRLPPEVNTPSISLKYRMYQVKFIEASVHFTMTVSIMDDHISQILSCQPSTFLQSSVHFTWAELYFYSWPQFLKEFLQSRILNALRLTSNMNIPLMGQYFQIHIGTAQLDVRSNFNFQRILSYFACTWLREEILSCRS